MQRIKLTPKQHAFLNFAASNSGMPAYARDHKSTGTLSKLGLVTMRDGHWFATDKGRAVLDVIENPDAVVMFNT